MDAADKLYQALAEDFGFKNANGKIDFKLKDYGIIVEQNNVVGNILEEWLAKWMKSKNIPHIHNHKQASPDFWLNPDDLNSDWLEVKSFTGSPNFDISAFRSFITTIKTKPYKLKAKHLLIKYKMKDGIITIEDFWMKSLWEICCTSEKWPIKVQCKEGVITNIRPATWYSERADYSTFKSLEHFLAALEQTVYKYHATNNEADNWLDTVCKTYERVYGIKLNVPRWNDIKSQYID